MCQSIFVWFHLKIRVLFGYKEKRNTLLAWRTWCTFSQIAHRSGKRLFEIWPPCMILCTGSSIHSPLASCVRSCMFSWRTLCLHWVMLWPFGVSDFPSCFAAPGKGAADWQRDNIVQSLPNLSSSDNRPVTSTFPPFMKCTVCPVTVTLRVKSLINS